MCRIHTISDDYRLEYTTGAQRRSTLSFMKMQGAPPVDEKSTSLDICVVVNRAPRALQNLDAFHSRLHFKKRKEASFGETEFYNENDAKKKREREIVVVRLTATKRGHPWVCLWWIVGDEGRSIHPTTSWPLLHTHTQKREDGYAFPSVCRSDDTSAAHLLTPLFFRATPIHLEYPFDPATRRISIGNWGKENEEISFILKKNKKKKDNIQQPIVLSLRLMHHINRLAL